jgi:SAM-dependent methyltransferase
MASQWSRQDYLRNVQYRDSTKLLARANLHRKHSTSSVRFIPWLAAQIDWPEHARVLDVGCGPGWFWTQSTDVVPTAIRLTLSDLSPGMVTIASDRVRSTTSHVIEASLEADAQDLPFDDQSFDVVVANFMLYHVPEPLKAIGEFARVLRPSGALLTATNGPGNLREMNEVVNAIFGVNQSHRSIDAFGSETGAAMLESAFDRVAWHRYDDVIRCSDPEDVVAYICSSPPGENATPEQSTELREELGRRFEAGGGVMTISKNTGTFVSSLPRAPS